MLPRLFGQVAICGVVALVIVGVLPYEDVLKNGMAWNMLIFLAGFLTIINGMKVG